ncbi:MAG TPA: hypothetical protein VL400_20775 [Polyangiaceae bacterium]|nr:hypothetical protein [Polyangiaceae bacterium]
MAVAFLVTALVGFGPTYYLKGLTEAPPLSPLLHVHAAVFSAWLALLLGQTSLVAAHRVDLHRRLGMVGAALAATMIPLGIMTAIDAARRGSGPPGVEPAFFLIFPLGTIVMFGAFVGAALWKRRNPECHRRFMLLATITLMTPALARWPFVAQRPLPALALTTLFVVAAAIHDWRTRGRVHPIYVRGGLIILVSGPLRFFGGHSDIWQSFARLLIG